MLKKLRKSSGQVTLVLIGVAALAGCSDDRRDVYATREDCLADWSNKPEDCKPASDPKHSQRGFWYGPMYAASGFMAGRSWGSSQGSFSAARAAGASRSVGTTGGSSSRCGFGSSGSSSVSS